jgi:hypothetical protein
MKNPWAYVPNTIELSVNNHRDITYGYDKDTGIVDKQLRLKLSGFNIVVVKAKDNSGRKYRGTWLFVYDWVKPSFLP